MSHADHEWARELIAAHLAGGLNAEERARMEAHVATCAECIAEINEVGRFERGLEDVFKPIRPAPDLEEKVIRALRSAPERRSWGLFGKFLAAAAAAGLLGAVGYAILEMESPSGPEMAYVVEGIGRSNGAPPAPRAVMPANAARDGRGTNTWAFGDGWQEGQPRSYAGRYAQESDHNESLDREELRVKGKDELGHYESPAPAPVPAPPADPRFRGDKSLDDGLSQVGGLEFKDAAGTREETVLLAELQQQKGDSKAFYSYVDKAPKTPAAQRPSESLYFKPNASAGPGLAGAEKELAKVSTRNAAPAGERRKQDQQGAAEGKGQAGNPPQNDPAPQPVRKIIRSGDVEFEVESFDTSVAVIQKIAAEERGFIATVNSEKLANGKVRGSVVLRVPPEGLDTLLLKLRALGELKSQRIGSQDVTKAFYDSESRLRAARAMEERLLKIIKEGKGEIKDLLLAEKELGEWRTKIEQAEGEIRYYNSQINLSTLTITLQEKEIRAASGVVRTEKVDMAVEVEDVEKSHRDALAAIADAKGRVTRSELKQHAAGQLSSIIHFEVAPTASGPLRDRLRQLGTPARMDVNVLEENEGGAVRAGTEIRVTQKDSQFTVSMYNLANIQPRETTQINLATPDAEKAYKDILARVEKAGGRVVTSNLNRQRNDQTTGTLQFEVKTAEAEAVLADVRATGEVMRFTTSENPDVQNVTRSKRGFLVQVFAMGTVAPRETAHVSLGAKDVGAAFKILLEAARKGEARVLVSQLNEGDRRNVNARLDIDIRREHEAAIDAAIKAAGETLSRMSQRSEDSENVVDSKLKFVLTLRDLGILTPRETAKLTLAAKDVATSYKTLLEAARQAGAWTHVSQLIETDPQNVTAALTFDVLREQASALEAALKAAGTMYSRTAQQAAANSGAVESKSRYEITLFDRARIQPREIYTVGIEVGNVDQSAALLEKIVAEGKGTVEDVKESRDSGSGRQATIVTLRVPLAEAPATQERLKTLGSRKELDGRKNPSVPLNEVAVAQFVVTLSNDLILAPDAGPWANIKRGLGVSLTALSYALMLIMIGVCFVLPIALLALGGLKLYKKAKAKPA